MIKAEEINRWIRNANACCGAHSLCEEGCPLAGDDESGTYCRWEAGDMTQEQVDMIAEFVRPVDWSKVPVDTKVIVWENPDWKPRRYFAKYMNGKIYTFDAGATSWSHEPGCLMEWTHGELAEENDR